MLTRMSSHDELIGSKQACGILGIDKATLTRWAAAGTLTPAHKLPGRNGAYLFRAGDVIALAESRATA